MNWREGILGALFMLGVLAGTFVIAALSALWIGQSPHRAAMWVVAVIVTASLLFGYLVSKKFY